ncbi:HAD family hydrolase [Clostridium sp. C105KSO13]|uniref:HAD family hydrolase n=1 Tax=Clostridium sp. C105KSO13 TaxID=1776045 RepID=UPI0007405CDA|nr:HAD family phosphatase [Clostridium sp. C105KSO13]CUX22704.1 Phosphorylated carbohydrates phosphatase [Clostridium sp. C105KSO13]
MKFSEEAAHNVMNKHYAIFDMDGTLIDSMMYWKHLAEEFLESKGVTQISEDILEKIKPMTMTESAALFRQEFSLNGTPESIAMEMNAMMDEHYHKNIPLKSGVKEYLDFLYQKGVQMCVVSATAEPLMEACLKRLDILKYFCFLLSCETVGAGKDKPDAYLAAAKQLGASPADSAVYEDALYAVKTAKNAGFYVIGVYDESAEKNWNDIENLADETIRSYYVLNFPVI